MSKKSRVGSSRNPEDEPTVHFLNFRGWYVNIDELLRSEKGRMVIRGMTELFRHDASHDGSDESGRKDPRPDHPASWLP